VGKIRKPSPGSNRFERNPGSDDSEAARRGRKRGRLGGDVGGSTRKRGSGSCTVRFRERERRIADILKAAWQVATAFGWAAFSVERVASEAELGRATIYGYFGSLEALVLEMARQAHEELSDRIAASPGLRDALDVPVRFSKSNRAGFALLFPPAPDPRPAFSTEGLVQIQTEARQLLGHLLRLAESSGATLPADSRSATAFLTGIAMAGAVVPELSQSTTLRRRWQDFCLDGGPAADANKKKGDSS
jgi:AcrR family transcriptional regulator